MIKYAAIKDKNGKIYTATRHHLIFWRNAGADLSGGEQGFTTDTGEFVGRGEAARIAYACGQIKQEKSTLYSEDCIPLEGYSDEDGSKKWGDIRRPPGYE